MNSHKPRSPEKWEISLDSALKKLPDKQAPAALIPGVMEEIQARAIRPWHRRSCWQWPFAARAVSALALAIVAIWIVLAGARLGNILCGPTLRRWMEVAETVRNSLIGGLESALPAGRLWGFDFLHLGLLFGGLLLLAAYLACVGVGAAVCRAVRK